LVFKKLENKGVISSNINGRNKTYKIIADENEIMSLLITYKESFFDSLVDNIIKTWDLN